MTSQEDSRPGSLFGSFDPSKAAAGMDYVHKNQDAIKASLQKSLGESATGARLLQVAAQHKIGLRIIRNKGPQGFSPESQTVFIALPPDLSTAPAQAVLEYGGALRQAELSLHGIKNPDKSMSSEEYALHFDRKMLDTITTMCKITSELHQAGHQQFVDALLRMGHGDMYRAYVEQGPGDHLVNIYYKSLGIE